MTEMDWASSFQKELNNIGLNLIGVADGSQYQHIIAGCRSVLVIANTGSILWDHFMNDCIQDPSIFVNHRDPLDDWIQRKIQAIDPQPPSSRRWIRCASTDQFIDFRPLAEAAGLGHRSHLGLLIHPKYGLWISLRAAVFTTEYLPPTTPSATASPCLDCEKYCAQHCPGNAFDRNGWNISRCASFHQESTNCFTSCLSRLSCPIGMEFQHNALAHHYHSNKESGRKAICSFLGVPDQTRTNSLSWKDWS